MSKYLRKFETSAAYTAAEDTLDKPNVSYIVETNGVEYKPWVETRVVATVNVTSTSDPTQILNVDTYFSAVEIDGVEQPSVEKKYTFSTTGEHTVKYTLKNPTSIGTGAFATCSNLTSITIPDGVTIINSNAFTRCSGLTSITIGSGVTSIDGKAFQDCSGLTSVTCNATTAPTIQSTTFQGVKTGGTLTVPSGSTGYDVWMGTGNYYLGQYNWTKVEQ